MKTRAMFLKAEINTLMRKDPRTIEDSEKLASMRNELYIINERSRKIGELSVVGKLVHELDKKLSQKLYEKDMQSFEMGVG